MGTQNLIKTKERFTMILNSMRLNGLQAGNRYSYNKNSSFSICNALKDKSNKLVFRGRKDADGDIFMNRENMTNSSISSVPECERQNVESAIKFFKRFDSDSIINSLSQKNKWRYNDEFITIDDKDKNNIRVLLAYKVNGKGYLDVENISLNSLFVLLSNIASEDSKVMLDTLKSRLS